MNSPDLHEELARYTSKCRVDAVAVLANLGQNDQKLVDFSVDASETIGEIGAEERGGKTKLISNSLLKV